MFLYPVGRVMCCCCCSDRHRCCCCCCFWYLSLSCWGHTQTHTQITWHRNVNGLMCVRKSFRSSFGIQQIAINTAKHSQVNRHSWHHSFGSSSLFHIAWNTDQTTTQSIAIFSFADLEVLDRHVDNQHTSYFVNTIQYKTWHRLHYAFQCCNTNQFDRSNWSTCQNIYKLIDEMWNNWWMMILFWMWKRTLFYVPREHFLIKRSILFRMCFFRLHAERSKRNILICTTLANTYIIEFILDSSKFFFLISIGNSFLFHLLNRF